MTYAEAMAGAVRDSAPLMKADGFRKQRHSFNRAVDDGIVHHLSFQMGAFDPPGTVEIPGLRPNLYGKFTINLGVYVPHMRRQQAAKQGWVNDYNCNLRYRLGELMPEKADLWWNLDHSDAGPDAARAIADYALPWLGTLRSNADIVQTFEKSGLQHLGMNASGALDMVDLYSALGDHARAHAVLDEYVRRDMVGHHVPYVAKYLAERGLDDLVPILYDHHPEAPR
jgi:hypothetical protein